MTVEFTGERFVPSIAGEIRHEHVHRYAFSLLFVRGKDVLDVACGEGYGSALLSEHARRVVGADISADVIDEARRTYSGRSNLEFVPGDAAAMPFADRSFDVVVSFETIEHHDRHEEMMRECARVLRPDGLLVLSSPNKKVYSDDANYHNEFHVKELYFAELDALVRRHFKHVEYLGQRLATGSTIYPIGGESGSNVTVWADDGSQTRAGMPRLEGPVYFLALATQERRPLAAAGSVLISQADDLYGEFKKVAHWASGVHNELVAAQDGARQALDAAREVHATDQRHAMEALADAKRAEGAAQAHAALVERQRRDELAHAHEQARSMEAALNGQLLQSASRLAATGAELDALRTRAMTADAELHDVRTAFERHKLVTQEKFTHLDRENAEQMERAGREKSALQQALDRNQTLLAARDGEVILLNSNLQTLEGERRADRQRAEAEKSRRDGEVAAARLKERQLLDQVAAVQLQATRRDEALQRELMDLQRRTHSADASASARIVELTRALQAQRAQLRHLAQHAQWVSDSLWWRLAAPIRHLADSLLGREWHANASALLDAVAQAQAFDLTDPRDLARFTSIPLRPSGSSFMSLATRPLGATPLSVQDLLALDGARFVEHAYLAVLGREADRDGLEHYGGLLAKGIEKVEILSHLRYSDEGKRRQADVVGLETALKDLRLSQLPLVGRMFRRRLRPRLSRSSPPSVRKHATSTARDRATLALHEQIDAIAAEADRQAELMCMAQSLLGHRDALEFDVFRTARALLRGNDDEFMTLLYRVLLQRASGAHEQRHYGDLLSSGASRQHIVDIILRSTEFARAPNRLIAAEAPAQLPAPIERSIAQDVFAAPTPPVASDLPLPTLPWHANPVVSVIVPVYGKVDYTAQCLRSIAANPPRLPFEVIVVDDCSPDDTVALLLEVQGLRLVQNAQNLGFIRSCNHGAREARGEYLCFLNNDTEVHAGWLDELVRTFAVFPGTGLAGSKLVYPDGSLQEAGGILWRDGSAWNFGRGQAPDLPVFNYAREVDYCSGASIMVPAALFAELGGFDEHYVPAYCEDSDLALKIRDRGHRVIYQPMSVVVHHEGITSGTDTGQGAKAYQVANSKKLFERWKDRLSTHQANGVNADNAKDRRMQRRVLVLEHCTPTPDQDAGSVSVFNMLLLLREMDFQVTFIAEDNFLYMPDYTVMLQRAGIEVLYAPYTTSVVQHLQDAGGRYDLVYLFRPVVVERHIDAIRLFCPQAKVLFYTHDIHHIRMEREASLLASADKAREAAEMKAREFKAIRAVDSTIVVSTTEMEILQPQLPDQRLQLLPLLLDIPGTTAPFEDREGIVFVGGYQHTPNVDAVLYFVNEVMPLLRPRLPGVRFHAVGSKPPASVTALAAPDVDIVGFVEDLKPMLDRMRVSVAPLRYGAGIKGKVGTALANGVPTVVSPIAAEGMSIVNGEHVLIAETTEEFVDAIVRLYGDHSLWDRISRQGIECAQRTWGPRAAFENFGAIISNLGLKVDKPPMPLSLYTAGTYR